MIHLSINQSNPRDDVFMGHISQAAILLSHAELRHGAERSAAASAPVVWTAEQLD